jgi:hypothetical protein
MKRLSLPIPSKDQLLELYTNKKLSVSKISEQLHCSDNRINYWLSKYQIKKQTISDAVYQINNPLGDPFSIKNPITLEQGILFGMGLGL